MRLLAFILALAPCALAAPAHARARGPRIQLELHWGRLDRGWSRADEEKVIDELLEIAQNDELEVRLAAVEVIAELDSPRAVAALSVILWTNQRAVRLRAAEVLGNIATPEALDAIALAAYSERDPAVRNVLARIARERLPAEEDDLPEETAVVVIP